MISFKLVFSQFALLVAVGCNQVPSIEDAGNWDTTYESAVHDSAIRDASWSVRLRPLRGEVIVTVATFSQYDPVDTEHHDVWVSNPEELREKCEGHRDPTLAIQQVLGLPPRKAQPGHDWKVVIFDVYAQQVFRPCPGDTRLSAQSCPGTGGMGEMDDDTARFLLTQFWSSRHASAEGDYGLPFTGMGWTYNWDPRAADHIGVSEFVVRKGSQARNVRVMTPNQLCNENVFW